MTCHLVVASKDAQLSARQAESKPHRNKRGQLLAYMTMVQASRKRRAQLDYLVWGVVSDGLEYYPAGYAGRVVLGDISIDARSLAEYCQYFRYIHLAFHRLILSSASRSSLMNGFEDNAVSK